METPQKTERKTAEEIAKKVYLTGEGEPILKSLVSCMNLYADQEVTLAIKEKDEELRRHQDKLSEWNKLLRERDLRIKQLEEGLYKIAKMKENDIIEIDSYSVCLELCQEIAEQLLEAEKPKE